MQQDEALIRDQIHQLELEQSDVETLTTEERLMLGNLRSKLTNIKNKLNIFNQSE
ncbi:hypothetical protein [Spiroplasma endosymbiont of Nebria brevicollis]|uniref:hypothetical protein n=1 Tax=Spiroplasma endosymbiont of Nebria brevicollis TaxID=3066284 RepID=UPI00313D615C